MRRTIILLLIACGALHYGCAHKEAARQTVDVRHGNILEIRATTNRPIGTEVPAFVDHGRRFYTIDAPLITDVDVIGAEQVDVGEGKIGVRLTFSEAAQARLKIAEPKYLDKNVAVYLNGELFSTPIVRGPLTNVFLLARYDRPLTDQEIEMMLQTARTAQGSGPSLPPK